MRITLISQMIWKISSLQNSSPQKDIFFSTPREKNCIKVILPDFVIYWKSKYMTKNNSRIIQRHAIYYTNRSINRLIISRESRFNSSMMEVPII